MGKVDIATKQYMSHRDIMADAFNFYLYNGRQVIKPDRLQKIIMYPIRWTRQAKGIV